MNKIVTFGEVMLRLSPPGQLRLRQANALDVLFGGAEANVAVCLAQWGMPASFVSRLPENDIAEACIAQMRGLGVGVTDILRGGDRMGVYFVERGAGQRPYTVLYDRAHSAISEIDPAELDWDALLDGATGFHTTGITLALSHNAAKAAADGMQAAAENGLTVSFDPNYRAKLWSEADAAKTITPLMQYVDTLFAGVGDAEKLFGVEAPDTDDAQEKGIDVAQQLIRRFPSVTTVAMQLRKSSSASGGSWTGLLCHHVNTFVARAYEIDDTVDRIGTGDAFAAGVLYGLLTGKTMQEAIELGTAAGCLKHNVHGDFFISRREEIEELAGGGHGGRVQR